MEHFNELSEPVRKNLQALQTMAGCEVSFMENENESTKEIAPYQVNVTRGGELVGSGVGSSRDTAAAEAFLEALTILELNGAIQVLP